MHGRMITNHEDKKTWRKMNVLMNRVADIRDTHVIHTCARTCGQHTVIW
jgi:hypothetical protein